MNATDMSRDRYVSQLTHTTATKQKHGGYPVVHKKNRNLCVKIKFLFSSLNQNFALTLPAELVLTQNKMIMKHFTQRVLCAE